MSWSPDNTIITNLGLEMLAKAQVGAGKLTITKIVTTDTVSDSERNKELSGDSTQITYKQECEIMNAYGGKVFDDEENQNAGESRITARVSNENVSEKGTLKPYSIHQIIIFAQLTNLTDPTVDMGEIPYMVAQSVGTPDYMPDFSKNPVAINYDLYVLHSGIAEINVKADVSGFVKQEAFNGVVEGFNEDIKNINDTKAGENTENITTFKPWTPVYTVDDEVIRWEKQSSTTAVSGKKSAERFNQYGSAENNIAIGENSHAENKDTVVLSENSHVEGESNYIGTFSPNTHVEGTRNSAFRGKNQHIEGSTNQGNGQNTHIEGSDNRADTADTDQNNHIEGNFNFIDNGSNHHVGGSDNSVSGNTNNVVGERNKVSGNANNVSGADSTVRGTYNMVTGENQSVSDDSRDTFVTGDSNNLYETQHSNVSGESNSVRAATSSIISGTNQEVVSVNYSSILGEANTVKNSTGNSIASNNNNLQSVNYSIISGSSNGVTNSSEDLITGNDNTVSETTSSVVMGVMNETGSETQGEYDGSVSTYKVVNTTVLGTGNTVKSTYNSVVSGSGNHSTSSAKTYGVDSRETLSCIITGELNNTSGNKNSFIGGSNNTVSRITDSIVCGTENTASELVNSIVIGESNNFVPRGNASSLQNVLCLGNRNTIDNAGYSSSTYANPKGAIGTGNTVSGPWTYAIGNNLKADGSTQLVVGKYNEPSDATFIIGTGVGDEERQNAFWVKDDYAYAKNFQAVDSVKSPEFMYSDGKEVKEVIEEKIAALVDGAPETLNTLKELAEALSSAEDVIEALQTYSVKKKWIMQDTELTSSNGTCTWLIEHGMTFVNNRGHLTGGYIIQIMDSLNNVVNCNIRNNDKSSTVTFSSSSNISANTYKAIIIGGSNTEN